jgi:hypothetical protein
MLERLHGIWFRDINGSAFWAWLIVALILLAVGVALFAAGPSWVCNPAGSCSDG